MTSDMVSQVVPIDPPASATGHGMLARPEPSNLADVLERVLDKGIVIAGDVRVNLVDIELLTVRLRLLVASVDRAREMGIDWWEHDPMLSSVARERGDHPWIGTPDEHRPEEASGADEEAGPDGGDHG